MPGITFAWTLSGEPPTYEAGLIGKSTTIRAGDAVAQTTNATYSISSVPAVRPLLAADKTAHYKQGTPVAGIMGIAAYSGVSNASGVWNAGITPANVAQGALPVYSFPSQGMGVPVDPNTGQSRIQMYSTRVQNVFRCALDATSANATPALNNTLAGLILTTSGGITTFTIDTNAAAADQCLIIIKCDESDPLYGAAGGRVFFQFLAAFAQPVTGVNYSSQ